MSTGRVRVHHGAAWPLRIGIAVVGAMLLAACAGAAAPDVRVHVRVRNEGPLAWQGMWLGAGGPNGHLESFGSLAPGELTPYHALQPQLANYRKSDVLIRRGLRYGNIVEPEHHLGTRTLPPGRYTFAYRIDGTELLLDIHRDR